MDIACSRGALHVQTLLFVMVVPSLLLNVSTLKALRINFYYKHLGTYALHDLF